MSILKTLLYLIVLSNMFTILYYLYLHLKENGGITLVIKEKLKVLKSDFNNSPKLDVLLSIPFLLLSLPVIIPFLLLFTNIILLIVKIKTKITPDIELDSLILKLTIFCMLFLCIGLFYYAKIV